MSKITAAITAVGAYVPDFVLSNKVLETLVDTNDEWITSRTGIKERRLLKEEGKGTSFLAIKAAQNLIDKATVIAKALNRTPPKQIEHWAKIGKIMEDNPDLPYEFVRQAIIAQAERDTGKLEAYDFG